MTLPDVPKWRTRVYSTTEKSCGTRRAGISVPGEESTYAPSIRKMINPPKEFTARARSQRQREQTERSPNRRKQLETRSKSTIKASKRKDKARGKMRRSRPRDKRSRRSSKVQRQRMQNDASVNKETYRTGPREVDREVYRATMAINNRLQNKSSEVQQTSKGGMIMSKMRPTDK